MNRNDEITNEITIKNENPINKYFIFPNFNTKLTNLNVEFLTIFELKLLLHRHHHCKYRQHRTHLVSVHGRALSEFERHWKKNNIHLIRKFITSYRMINRITCNRLDGQVKWLHHEHSHDPYQGQESFQWHK